MARDVSLAWDGGPGFGRLGALLVPVLHAGLGHALTDAALFDEVLLQAATLLVEEVVGLVDEAERDVGEDFGRARFKEGAVGLEGFVLFAAKPADVESLLGALLPLGMVAHAEEVLVVEQQFLQAGPRVIDEFQLRLS